MKALVGLSAAAERALGYRMDDALVIREVDGRAAGTSAAGDWLDGNDSSGTSSSSENNNSNNHNNNGSRSSSNMSSAPRSTGFAEGPAPSRLPQEHVATVGQQQRRRLLALALSQNRGGRGRTHNNPGRDNGRDDARDVKAALHLSSAPPHVRLAVRLAELLVLPSREAAQLYDAMARNRIFGTSGTATSTTTTTTTSVTTTTATTAGGSVGRGSGGGGGGGSDGRGGWW
jgi:hypothetical protein